MRRKSRYERALERSNAPRNIWWNDIQRMIRYRDDHNRPKPHNLTDNESRFLDDLNRRGRDYAMSENQIRWLQTIGRKMYQ